MRIAFDVTSHNAPISGTRVRGTESWDWRLFKLFRDAGHEVYVVSNEQGDAIVDGITFWPTAYHPSKCDVLIMADELQRMPAYQFDRCFVPLTRIDPVLQGHQEQVDGFVGFSPFHCEALIQTSKGAILPEQCYAIEPGVDLNPPEGPKDMKQALWSNSPDRGLVHIARWWDRVVDEVPDAQIHLTYRLQSFLEEKRYLHDQIAMDAMDIMDWVHRGRGVIGHGQLARTDPMESPVKPFQRECGLYIYPCTPMHQGSITTAFAVHEAAAAGMHLLLSSADALPHEYGSIATILGPAGAWNYDAWVEETVRRMRMTEAEAYTEAANNMAWAAERPWSLHEQRWLSLVEGKPDAPPRYAQLPGLLRLDREPSV